MNEDREQKPKLPYGLDERHLLNEPLTNEDGTPNEACWWELMDALANCPRTYDRLADNPEWSTPRLTWRTDITGGLAKYALRQSPGFPEGLEQVVGYLDAALKRLVCWNIGEPHPHGMAELSLCGINRLLYDVLYDQGISTFDAWNEPKREPTQAERMAEIEGKCSRDPDTEFIDLDALLRNVCLDIRLERRDFDRFNAEFEAEFEARQEQQRKDELA